MELRPGAYRVQHLKVLREAGLVRIAETRQIRGGTEQYYRRTARRIVVAEPQGAGTPAMFAAVAQELNHSPTETHLTLRHLKLSPAKAQQLGETLARLVDDAEEDADDQPVLGVLVTLYQQVGPTAGTA
ncbi:transcriptional regulator [Streptomyces sp. NPDC002785]|uniref:transcriptional regulator n=1 Tax=Streptomyces sp. NPDC002785 TaxID=3154543 RepID=UPI00332B4F45